MSVADKITRLSNARDDIIDALGEKDVTATGHGFEDFADDIRSIQSGGSVIISDTMDSHGGIVKTITTTGETITLQSKTVTPSSVQQTITADTGYTGLSEVIVNSGITLDDLATNSAPSGAITLDSSITSIGEYALAGKPITSIIAPNVTSIGEHCLQNTQITDIADANFPLLGVNSRFMILLRINTLQHLKLTGEQLTLHSGSGALRDMTNLVSVELPNCAKNVGASYLYMGNACFYGDKKLEFVDIGFCQSIGSTGFYNCNKIQTIVARYTSVVSLTNTNAFTNTPFNGYDGLSGTVYVPQNLISSYQTATNWSILYTAGTISFVALEGSQYENYYADGTPIS